MCRLEGDGEPWCFPFSEPVEEFVSRIEGVKVAFCSAWTEAGRGVVDISSLLMGAVCKRMEGLPV